MKLKFATLPILLATASLAIAAPAERRTRPHTAHPPKAEGASKPKPDTKPPLKEFFHPGETRSTGTVTAGGQPITYDAVAGTLVVHAKEWEDTDAIEADADSDKSADKDKKGPEPAKPFDFDKAILPERERPENTPGAMLRVQLDTEHWLASGTDGEIQVMVEGQRVFTPVKLDKGRNVGVYAKKDRLVAGGLVWEEARDQLAEKAYLVEQSLGRGHVVGFAEDPNYRAFAEATELLFINAVLLSPSH